jgi:hypothetical protein
MILSQSCHQVARAARAACEREQLRLVARRRGLQGVEVGNEGQAKRQKCLKGCGKERHEKQNRLLSKYCNSQANSTLRILPTLQETLVVLT